MVIATGTRPKHLYSLTALPSIEDRLYYEVYPLREVNGKHIAVIGAGDAAFDYALNLSQRNQVTLLNRSAKLNCLPLLWERVCKTANIHYLANTEIRCARKTEPAGLLLECHTPDSYMNLRIDFLVAAIGREPQVDLLSVDFLNQVEALKQQGKLYLIGDVKNEIFRQTSIAAGEGIMAAMKIYQKYKEDQA
jgi:thioredoxin reductase